LNIDHEKFILFFLYRYAINKTEQELVLLLKGLRFSYLEIKHLLDLARDHLVIRQNSYFIKKIEYEFQKRFHNLISIDEKPRKLYK
jgi:hypothetical protein